MQDVGAASPASYVHFFSYALSRERESSIGYILVRYGLLLAGGCAVLAAALGVVAGPMR